MTHPICGLIGKLADGAVERVVIGSCLKIFGLRF
jgi:hypothetical protein